MIVKDLGQSLPVLRTDRGDLRSERRGTHVDDLQATCQSSPLLKLDHELERIAVLYEQAADASTVLTQVRIEGPRPDEYEFSGRSRSLPHFAQPRRLFACSCRYSICTYPSIPDTPALTQSSFILVYNPPIRTGRTPARFSRVKGL